MDATVVEPSPFTMLSVSAKLLSSPTPRPNSRGRAETTACPSLEDRADIGQAPTIELQKRPAFSASPKSLWLSKLASVAIVSLAALAHPVWAAGLAEMPLINKAQEMRILGGTNQPAKLVRLAEGQPGKGATISIHGANGKPEDLKVWDQLAQSEGQEVHTLAFDDMQRRLRDNSQDLAKHMHQWLQANPGQPLHLQAYCMGARIALGALAELQKDGKMPSSPIQVTLLAPPLAGIPSADWAQLDIGGLFGALIPGVRIGYDMGPSSSFQKQLDQLKLPDNVRTRILIGSEDAVVNAADADFQRLAKSLGAQVEILPGVDHNNIAQRAIPWN